MTRKALGSKQCEGHLKKAEVNKATKAAEKGLAEKPFEDLTAEDKDLLLKLIAVRLHLIQPS